MKIDDAIKLLDAGLNYTEINALGEAAAPKIIKLIDGGLTLDQIKQLDTDGLFTYAGANKSENGEDQGGSTATATANKSVDFSEVQKLITDGMNTVKAEIINAMQKAAVGATKQPPQDEQSDEELLASIINPQIIDHSKGGK